MAKARKPDADSADTSGRGGNGADPKSKKSGTVLRDLRRHHLLVTEEEFAKACSLHKRTINRVELGEPVRATTQLTIVRGLNKMLSDMHGVQIRLAITDVFEDDVALGGIDRRLPLEKRGALRRAFFDQLLQQRVLQPIKADDRPQRT